MSARIDNIILGDNQFSGVNHLSQALGQLKAIKFQDDNEIKKIIEYAISQGAQGMMLSTHAEVERILNIIRNDDLLQNNLNIYPNIPDIAKYVRRATTQGGITGLMKSILSQLSFGMKASLIIEGGKGLMKKDILKMLEVLIDLEMAFFRGLKIKAIFLHTIVVDLALGLGLDQILSHYYSYIKDKYNVIPGFGTLNLPKLLNKLQMLGIDYPLIMTSVNKKGFYMNPSKAACEEVINDGKCEILAIGTLASGAISLREAYEYLFSFHNIKSLVIGASTKDHIKQSFDLVKSYHAHRQQ
ncbi:hypothetical protein KKC91_03265 [bacterium]|nr:hypothetical protein [bacterium]